MSNWISIDLNAIAGICLSITIIYIAVILFTRIFGKRSFSKMSSFDFPMTIAVGSIIASTILSPKPSIMQAIVGLLMVYILQLIAAYLRRYKPFEELIDNSPLLLMDGSKILKENLLKARVTETDLRGKIREANVVQLSDIKAVIFETTGDISIIHKNDDTEIDSWIMKDVKLE